MRTMLKSKIHRIKVTQTELGYEGSITIDADVLFKADIMEYEQVYVLNVNNGNRFITYAMKGKTGECCVNGAAARLVCAGDVLIILSYEIKDVRPGWYNKPIIVKMEP